MTAPATFNSAIRIITFAMRNAGLLERGQEPNSEDTADYMNRLSDMINTWATQGLKLWTQYDQTVPLVAGQAAYTFGPGGDIDLTYKPLRVLQGYYETVTSDTNDRRPLQVLSRDEYTQLANTAQTGPINSYFTDKIIPLLKVYFWLTPDAEAADNGSAHLIMQRAITNVDGILDTVDFPTEWYLALQWGLADEICTGQPMAVIQRCMQKALMYRDMLENWDVEDAATQFQPDQRMQYSGSGFR